MMLSILTKPSSFHRCRLITSTTSLKQQQCSITRPFVYQSISTIIPSSNFNDVLVNKYNHPCTVSSSFPRLDQSPPLLLNQRCYLQQVRWKGRNDGNKYQGKERVPTKKSRKQYHRKLQKLQFEVEKHGKPGEKAGVRREWAQEMQNDLLDRANQVHESITSGMNGDNRALATLENDDDDDDDNNMDDDDYGVSDALLDDLIGNTSYLGSSPTPEPIYLGHKQQQYYNVVVDKMDEYRKIVEERSTSTTLKVIPEEVDAVIDMLPTDFDISLALRSLRDKKGTRTKPIGIVAALQYLIQDLRVPVTIWDELTYTTLLTCSRNEKEARRIFQMMKEQQVPISAYSWSILVDIHSRSADYNGCVRVMEEMINEGGIAPTLASYTSLLAACYKVCINSKVPHKIRAESGKVGWNKWKEMRIVGIEPDVMAYGALLRLTAVSGQPEKALNILKEMEQMKIKPTTLCYTSALRAIARSHSIAIRYENGTSKLNKRREMITSHHGKLTRSILIMAENAEIVQDDGFIAALAMCSAEAGDLATVKAIYIANQIRQLDQFRTIGPDTHLSKLRNGNNNNNNNIDNNTIENTTNQMMIGHNEFHSRGGEVNDIGSDGNSIMSMERSTHIATAVYPKKKKLKSFAEREYGNDSRVLTAILHACARSVDKSGIGTMWQGRENNGYLCDNSLRLLTARRIPRYTPDKIPGESITDNLTWDGEIRDSDDYRPGKRVPRKFRGVYGTNEQTGTSLADIDEPYASIYFDDDGKLKKEFQTMTPEDIWQLKYGNDKEINMLHNTDHRIAETSTTRNKSIEAGDAAVMNNDNKLPEVVEDMFFDYDTMSWKTRVINTNNSVSNDVNENNTEVEQQKLLVTKQEKRRNQNDENTLYFDYEDMKWKTRNEEVVEENVTTTTMTDYEAEVISLQTALTDFGLNGAENKSLELDGEGSFNLFFSELKKELKESDDDFVSEEEARELFMMMQEEYNDTDSIDLEGLELDQFLSQEKAAGRVLNDEDNMTDESSLGSFDSDQEVLNEDLERTLDDLNTTLEGQGVDWDESLGEYRSNDESQSHDLMVDNISSLEDLNSEVLDWHEVERNDSELEELKTFLPGFSDKRLRKTLTVFKKNLGNPPLLDLIAVAREKMPDYVTSTWLKQMSNLTANHLMQKVAEDKTYDTHILNGFLELQTTAGNVESAMECYTHQFAEHGAVPTEYSDRLVLQMLLRNRRLHRAMQFKQKIDKDGRKLDLQSYGSFIDYFSRHNQFGSAMTLLKECIYVHKSPPGEASLSKLRAIGRKIKDKSLFELIGNDPVEWLRDGEANRKREYSKKGRRDTVMARNQLVRI